MSYCVYKHTTPLGKVYIGITMQEPQKRWGNGKNYKKNKHFYQAIEKYGWENINHEILYEGINKEMACLIEQMLIARYNSTNREKGYNNSVGGDTGCLGYRHTPEEKEKIRLAGIGRKRSKNSIEKVAAKKRKAVNVYDVNGFFIAHCNSLTEAERMTGVANSNISACCKGKYKQFKGYIFKYADDNSEDVKTTVRNRPVEMLSTDGTLIKKFYNVKEASRQTNFSDTHIYDCCNKKIKMYKGYIWKYV